MRNDRTNRLAMLLVVFCCLGTTAMAMPTSTQRVLTVVVVGPTSHIAYELEPFDFQIQNRKMVPSFVTHNNPILPGLNMELQNLPPPSAR
jgi:hypothetical protein